MRFRGIVEADGVLWEPHWNCNEIPRELPIKRLAPTMSPNSCGEPLEGVEELSRSKGSTADTSRPGLMNRGGQVLEPDTGYEMNCVMPFRVAMDGSDNVIWTRRIVRKGPRSSTKSFSSLPAPSLDYGFPLGQSLLYVQGLQEIALKAILSSTGALTARIRAERKDLS